jgi:hypothetical protein
MIFFCLSHGDEVMDLIPMDEVGQIMDSDKSIQNEDTNWLSRDGPDEDSDPMTPGESNIIRIETIPDGYNSGRAYYLQVHPIVANCGFSLFIVILRQVKVGAERRAICNNIGKFAKRAREEALAKTRFRRSQEIVRQYFSSTACQATLAVLIFAVMHHITRDTSCS